MKHLFSIRHVSDLRILVLLGLMILPLYGAPLMGGNQVPELQGKTAHFHTGDPSTLQLILSHVCFSEETEEDTHSEEQEQFYESCLLHKQVRCCFTHDSLDKRLEAEFTASYRQVPPIYLLDEQFRL